MGFLAAAVPLATSLFAGTASAGTLAAVSTAATAGSAVLGAGGALMEGSASAGMHKYRAQVARNNAVIADQNAEQSLIAGQKAESGQRFKVGRLVSQQKATQAASGVDVDVGSAPFVRDVTQAEGDLDALAIRYNAARESYGYRVEAQSKRAEADLEKKAAKYAKVKSYIGAATSIIGGIGGIANQGAANAAAGVK